MYRFWHGPVIGLAVSHVWSSFATCLFMEFGHLTPGGTYTNLKGDVRKFEPRGGELEPRHQAKLDHETQRELSDPSSSAEDLRWAQGYRRRQQRLHRCD
jgi:hypothetical protein